jgi:FkbM family methyltransferase
MIGSLLRRLASGFGYSLSIDYPAFLRQPSAKLGLNPSWFLSHLACMQEKVSFIQIGANDGISNDPIRRYVLRCKWSGLLVEPDPNLFRKLQNNYTDQPQLQFLNAAVGTGDPMDFYSVDPSAPGAPPWANNLGSFKKDVVLSHAEAWPSIEKHLHTHRIPTVTTDQLFEHFGERSVDLLIMDVEGYEWEIIRQIDFRARDVGFIYYESKHLTRSVHEQVVDYLVGSGYRVSVGDVDSVAVNKNRRC